MSILLLPNEVLSCIFQYLTFSDRSVIARSCRTLYNALLDAGLKGASVTLEDGDLARAINTLKSSSQSIEKITFKSSDLQNEHFQGWKEFWENVGPGVKSLEFCACDISERTFFNILRKCPYVQHLVIDDCNSLLMSGKLLETHIKSEEDVPEALVSLKSLEICNNRYLSDALFNRLVSFSEKLERISLAGCPVSFHAGIFKKFYPANREILASESVLTYQNIAKFIERQASKIKSLNFSSTSIDDKTLDALAKIPDLKLRELHLVKCGQVTKRGIDVLCGQQPSLCILNVTDCLKLDDEAMLSVSLYAPELEVLHLCGVYQLTVEGFADLVKLKKLRELDLCACEKLTTKCLHATLCAPPMLNLTLLNLSTCTITDDALTDIVTHLTMLRQLNLSRCKVTDRVLRAISKHLRWLRVLDVSWCCAITDFGLTGRYYRVPSLPPKPAALNLTQNGFRLQKNGFNGRICPQTEVAIDPEVPSGLGEPLHNLCGLQELSLCGCTEITDVGVKVAFHFLELRKLNLSQCRRITDSGLVALGAFNRSLENVTLSRCNEITENGVLDLAKCLPRLKHLDVQGCTKFGNVNSEMLRQWCPDLRHLDVDPLRAKSSFQMFHGPWKRA